MTPDRIIHLRDHYRRSLLEDTVPFWMAHGVDREAGGFFNCLERDGSVYSTDKSVWLTARATWLYATLYGMVEARPEWLELARHGYAFLVRHCFDGQGKMLFSVTRDGRPLRMRRYTFSEVFAVLAFVALAKATGEEEVRRRALALFDVLVGHFTTPGRIAPKVSPRTRPMKVLSPTMCLLNVADVLLGLGDDPAGEGLVSESIEVIFRDFVKADDAMVLETVGPNGERLDTPEGRCMNPGHAIESAWFIMEVARRRDDAALACRAARILDWSFERGWDHEYGGLFYYVDVAQKPSPYLEHDMKLWWPHCEALYATLLAYHLTGEARYAALHERVFEWAMGHFPDARFGEWFGYLHRDGSRSTSLKGNMWKGAFHLPRSQLLCWKLLEEMSR